MTSNEEDLTRALLDFDDKKSAFCPWEQRYSPAFNRQVELKKRVLEIKAGAKPIPDNVIIAPDANIFTTVFSIGSGSWIASGAIIRGNVRIGSNTSVNPYCHIAGTIRIGDSVRIANNVNIFGFNHGFSRTDKEIRVQPHTSKGIVIQDDIWIGTNVFVADGVTIGAHSVVAAGAVVTTSFPEYSIIGGNPARLIRSRLQTPGLDAGDPITPESGTGTARSSGK